MFVKKKTISMIKEHVKNVDQTVQLVVQQQLVILVVMLPIEKMLLIASQNHNSMKRIQWNVVQVDAIKHVKHVKEISQLIVHLAIKKKTSEKRMIKENVNV